MGQGMGWWLGRVLSICLSVSVFPCVSDSYLISFAFNLSLPACICLCLSWSQSLFLSVRYKQDQDFLLETRN